MTAPESGLAHQTPQHSFWWLGTLLGLRARDSSLSAAVPGVLVDISCNLGLVSPASEPLKELVALDAVPSRELPVEQRLVPFPVD